MKFQVLKTSENVDLKAFCNLSKYIFIKLREMLYMSLKLRLLKSRLKRWFQMDFSLRFGWGLDKKD
jgi:hypothetical protein